MFCLRKLVLALVGWTVGLSVCASVLAQTGAHGSAPVIQIKLGQSAVALNGPWKFSTGDSPIDVATGKPLWAEPGFDDSQWETMDVSSSAGAVDPVNGLAGYAPGWTQRGHAGYWGYAWYRIRIQLETLPGDKLALAGPADVDDVYQAFANGALLGSFGGFSGGRPVPYYAQPKMFALPQAVEAGPIRGSGTGTQPHLTSYVLAFRIWMEPNSLVNQPDAGGFHNAPVLGETSAVAAGYQLRWLELIRSYIFRFVEGVAYLLLALLVLSLSLFDRGDRVYLWIAAVLVGIASTNLMVGMAAWTQWVTYIIPQILQALLTGLVFAGWAMVWWVWFRLRRPVWMPQAIAALLLMLITCSVMGQGLFFTVIPQSVDAGFHVASLTLRVIFLLLIVAIVILGIRQQGREGFLVLPAVVLLGISRFNAELSVLHIRITWFPFGVQLGLATIANLLLVAGLSVLLLRRLLDSVRKQRLMALDVKQAQEVQQVILPEAQASFAGLLIESVYRPAREVGGDFFQIIPHPGPHTGDGSLLIVAGDVTGKGLQAGMLVALLVGAIRSTVDWSADPLVVLGALNQRLLGRGESAATCLALRVDSGGAVTLANAGHMPPYLNAEPVAMEGALPLGICDGAEFSVMQFQLAEGDRLVLMSDGIAEAMGSDGQLFGFERVHALLSSRPSAKEVADAAQRFGQEDDISVIAVTRSATLAG